MAVKKFANFVSEIRTEAELIRQVSGIITEITGVQLGEKQYSLVQGRLARRMRDLKINDPHEYARHLAENEGVETGVLISLLTTHHTYFFREFQHFEFLLKTTLPQVIASHEGRGLDTIRIWSAACSRGQEVYSLSMFLQHHLAQIAPKMKFKIMGSDVCQESVAIAKNGVYTWEEVKAVPSVYLQGNWARGTGEIAEFVRAKESLRNTTEFKVLNLMNFAKDLSEDRFDVIFCRNVFIYFTPMQIKSISGELLKKLNPAGHLFIGVSESLNGLDLPVDWVGPSVYAPRGAPKNAEAGAKIIALNAKDLSRSSTAGPGSLSTRSQASARTREAPPALPDKLRVVCVDDSPTVLALFKRIFTSEKGFELVGTAGDGIDAIAKIRALKPDVITLDIHMPNMNGLQFLESYGRSLNVPVVMVSSVSREESEIAFKCLELGAADYIEKPSLENLARIEEELHFKLRSATESKARGVHPARALELDQSFKRPPLILSPAGKLRVVVASFAVRDELAELLSKFRVPQPPTVALLEGAGALCREWVDRQRGKIRGLNAEEPTSLHSLAPNSIAVREFSRGIDLLKKEMAGLDVSVLVMSPLNAQTVKRLTELPSSHLILEDRGEGNPQALVQRASEVVPLTSFVYESDRYFAKNANNTKVVKGEQAK